MQVIHLVGELPDKKELDSLLVALLDVAQSDKEKTPLREAAIASLSGFVSADIGDKIITTWPELPASVKSAAGGLLATRPIWTKQWLDACKSERIAPGELSLESVRAMRNHVDPVIQKDLNELYPATANLDLIAVQKRCDEIARLIEAGNGNPYAGKKLFQSVCSRCHKLFDNGGEIGPDLTGYQRDQLQTLLRNVIAPSLEIREGYRTVQILTSDERVLTGFIESRTDADQSTVHEKELNNRSTDGQPQKGIIRQIVIRSIDGASHVIQADEIVEIKEQLLSLMPDGLLDKLSDQEVVDLIAYLRSSQPLSDG